MTLPNPETSSTPKPKKKRKPRKPMPTKSSIAAYWAEQEIEGNPLVEKINHSISGDWGEPNCWACGIGPSFCTPFMQSACDVDYREGESIYKCWNRAKFLERCHIVPDSRGGSNDVSNFLLLCKECHKEAPDCTNPAFMKMYVINKECRFLQESDFIKNFVLKQCGMSEDQMNEIIRFCMSEENREEYGNYVLDKTLIGQNRFGITRTKKYTEGIASMIDFYQTSKGEKVLDI